MKHGIQELPKVYGLCASLCIAGVIVTHLLAGAGNNPYLRTAGAMVLLTATIFVCPPFFLLKKHGQVQAGQSYIHTSAVVDQGLYAVVRHPQYLGYMLLASGFALLSWHWLAVLLALLGIAGLYVQARAEERYCVRHMGAAYEQYLRRVPRFNVVWGIIRLVRHRH